MKATCIPTAFICLFLNSFLLNSCGQGGSRQEQVEKLRALGAVINPLFVRPSLDPDSPNTVELTVYLAVPPGKTPVMSYYDDEQFNAGFLLAENDFEITANHDSFVDYQQLRLYTMTATIKVPSLEALAQKGAKDFYQVRYGVSIQTQDDSEEIVGNFTVFPEPAPQAEWKNPEITITAPSPELTVVAGQELDITASYSNPNNEDLKFGWFVTGGEISNRRSTSTTWKAPSTGQHTILATVRGKTSRGLAIQAIEVNVE